jgi:hypothetical protein
MDKHNIKSKEGAHIEQTVVHTNYRRVKSSEQLMIVYFILLLSMALQFFCFTLDGGSARRKAATYKQNNTNTE